MAGFNVASAFYSIYRDEKSRLFQLPLDLKRYLIVPMLLGDARVQFQDGCGHILINSPSGSYIHGRSIGRKFIACWYTRCGWVASRQQGLSIELVWIGYHGEYDWDSIYCDGAADLIQAEPATVAQMRSYDIVINTVTADHNWDSMLVIKPVGFDSAYSRVVGWNARSKHIMLWDGGRKVMVADTSRGPLNWKVCRREFQYDCCSVCWTGEIRGITSWGYEERLKIWSNDLE